MSLSRRNFILASLALPAVEAGATSMQRGTVVPAVLRSSPGDPIELIQIHAVRKITVPGKMFAVSVRRLLAEMKSAFLTSTPYPIKRFFDILPLALIDGGVGQRLVDRGDLLFRDGKVSNTGEFVEAGFNDQNLGLLTIAFDEELTAKVSEPATEELLFDFSDHPPIVLLQGANRQFQVDSNQRALGVRLGPTKAIYELVSASRPPGQRLEITVDLTVGEEAFIRNRDRVLIAGLAWPPPPILLVANGPALCKCKCCGTDVCSPACPQQDAPNAPPFADFRPNCLWRRGSRVTALFRSNVLSQTPDHDPSREYVNRILVIRVLNLNCDRSTLFGEPISKARIRCEQIVIDKVLPPNTDQPIVTTTIFGQFISND